MPADPDVDQLAGALRVSIGLLLRRLRQVHVEGELTLPESAALVRLDRGGPTTSSALARLEQISPQSMGATLAALQARGLVERARDPSDGRRKLLSISRAGREVLRSRRQVRDRELARVLASEFTRPELAELMLVAPLIERLAQSI